MNKILRFLTKWELIDTSKFRITPRGKTGFILSDLEDKKAKEIYEKKGTISYEFIPCGIGWAVKVHVLKTNEEFDITDYDSW